MTYPVKSPRKLIEVALPLDLINAAAKEEKAVPRRGHPQTLHVWWARRPLAVARAVIFAQLVNDPGFQHGGGFRYGRNRKDAAIERRRLFKIIESLALWENTTNEEVLQSAKVEIRRSWREVCELNKDHPQADELFNPERLPGLHDPFSGGGTIPLEAQRLGLQACASDLNPVAVLLSRAMIEIPTKFAGSVPVGPLPIDERGARLDLRTEWPGASGLAEDVRRYGAWMLSEAKKRVGHLYPKYEITGEMAREFPNLKPYEGQQLTIIASLWARAVKSPNPAFSHVDVPLVIVSDKKGSQTYIQPIVNGESYHFSLKAGQAPPEAKLGTSAGRRAAFNCLISGSPIDYSYIRAEGMAGRLGQKLMAVVAEGPKGRIYLSPTPEMEAAAATAEPTWKPHCEMPKKHRNFQPPAYGMSELGDLFTSRQLVTLTTFSELVEEARDLVKRDALLAGLPDDEKPLAEDGRGATAYSQAVSVYLGCALSRLASYNNTICHWNIRGGSVGGIFSRHAIPMSWDYIEVNPLEKMSGNWVGGIEWVSDVLAELHPGQAGSAEQADASRQSLSQGKIISTDPPYYDNISYAPPCQHE